MLVLGVETSCDETSCGIFDAEKWKPISLYVLTQDHRDFGGVVPELSAREHLKFLPYVLKKTLEMGGVDIRDISLVCATYAPGLPGSLIIGLNFARGLAQSLGVPFQPVNHVEAHILSPLIEFKISFPYASLIVSGGHTTLFAVYGVGSYKTLLKTVDDAVGEAFDKVAKIFRLGYPGGPIIDNLSKGVEGEIRFPVSRVDNFTFSGLKTAVLRSASSWFGGLPMDEILSSFQKTAITEVFEKSIEKILELDIFSLAVVGGVARNSLAREISKKYEERGIKFYFPHPRYCVDNGMMVAVAGFLKFKENQEENNFLVDIIPTGVLKGRGGI